MTDKQIFQTIGLNLRRIAKMIFLGDNPKNIDYFVEETKNLTNIAKPKSLENVFKLVPWQDLFAKKYTVALADQLCTYGSMISLRASNL